MTVINSKGLLHNPGQCDIYLCIKSNILQKLAHTVSFFMIDISIRSFGLAFLEKSRNFVSWFIKYKARFFKFSVFYI